MKNATAPFKYRRIRYIWARKNATAPFKYRQIRYISFSPHSKAGHSNIDNFDLESAPPEFGENCQSKHDCRPSMPERLNIPLPIPKPMITKWRNAVLLANGTVLLDDGPFYDAPFREMSQFLPEIKKSNYITRDNIENYPQIFHHGRSALIRSHFRCIDLPGTHFSARSTFYWNFGHFVHDILSLIYYEELGAIVPGRDSVIAPPMLLPIQKALFHKVFEGYEIVSFPPNVPLKVEELLMPNNLCGYGSINPNPQAFNTLAKRVKRILAPYVGQCRRKICVSRRDGLDNSWRRLANLDAYENKMRELGYDILEISDLEPNNQFAIFANTMDIVGIHGAGMMNMIMMPSGGNYTEIAGTKRVDTIIRIAKTVGHRVAMLEGSALNKKGRIKLDLRRLEAMLLDSP